MFEAIIDDSLDATLEGQLLNQVKNTLEAQYLWVILRTSKESNIAQVGDTYLTMHALPADFAMPNKKGVFVGDDMTPYAQISFEDRIRFQSITHRYYLDYANNNYALCGVANPGGIIHFYYNKFSPDLNADTDTWIFPSRFHAILPYLMAKKFFAVDQGDKSRAYDDRWDIFSVEMMESMVQWNARLQLEGNANAAVAVDITARPDIVDIDAGGPGIIYG